MVLPNPLPSGPESTRVGFGFGSASDAGGGTRTPDTRIMIPLL
jgi:hypothetical protein